MEDGLAGCTFCVDTHAHVACVQVAKAGSLIMASGGADSGTAMEAYQLYCQAAGVLDELRRRLLPALGPQCICGDLSRELLTALHLFALGEAQVGRGGGGVEDSLRGQRDLEAAGGDLRGRRFPGTGHHTSHAVITEIGPATGCVE